MTLIIRGTASCEEPPGIIVAIPTFRRPASLLRLLHHLDRQTIAEPFAVVVADNDPVEKRGLEALRGERDRTYRFTVHAMLAERPGLASVRNTLLSAAMQIPSARLVAMIDDDEWPEPDWLDRLVSLQRSTKSDVVGGPVRAAFQSGASAEIAACRVFQPRCCESGPVDIVWATNNVLLTRQLIVAAGPDWFDAEYGLSGGEDSDFFVRHHMQGRRFAWCAEAIVHEDVPRSRANLRWILKRAFRIGTTNAHIQRRRQYLGRGRGLVMAVATGKLLYAVAGAPLRALACGSRADALYDIAEACGMLCGAFGLRFREYAR